jgi:hypothetical protein
MPVSSVDRDDVLVLKSWSTSGDGNDTNGTVVLGLHVESALGEAVQPPRVNVSVGGDGKRVERSRVDRLDFRLAGNFNLTGDEGLVVPTLVDSATKLVLLIVAPSPNLALVVQSESMVTSTDNTNNVLKLLDKDRGLLNVGIGGESQDTLIRLRTS